MKTLQERMNALRPYFRGIEMYNEALMVKVEYPSNWKAYPSADDRIKVTPSEDPSNPNLTYYYADSNEATYDDILDLVEETVNANQEVVLKLKLLREKVEELKELFSNESYDALKTLTFSLQSPKRKRAGKRTRTKDKASQEASERVVEQPTVAPVVEEPTKVVDDSNGMVTVRNAEGWLEGGAVSEG